MPDPCLSGPQEDTPGPRNIIRDAQPSNNLAKEPTRRPSPTPALAIGVGPPASLPTPATRPQTTRYSPRRATQVIPCRQAASNTVASVVPSTLPVA